MGWRLRTGLAGSLLFLFTLAGVAAGQAASPADAGGPARAAKSPGAKKSPKKKPIKLGGTFTLQLIYDDNVFRYSPENLLLFRQGLEAEKFKLDTYDDFIVSPRLEFSLDRRLFGSYDTGVRLRYTLWQYASNPDKTNESWWLRLRQPVTSGSFFELGYTYAPLAYIRQLSDRAPFDPRSTTPLTWLPFRSLRHGVTLSYQARLSSWLIGRVDAGRVIRYYNRPFLENDNWEWNGTGTAYMSLARAWRVAARYTYSNTKARAIDTVGEDRLTSDDGDPSYERDLYDLALRFQPRRAFGIFRQCEVSAQYQAYYFTSQQPYDLDPLHRGRKDEVWVGEVTAASIPIWRDVAIEAGYRYTQRRSSSTASSLGADSIEEDKNYNDNRTWLETSYSF